LTVEEVLAFLGFSLGASVAISLARGLGSGMSPALVQLFKAGLAAGDVARCRYPRRQHRQQRHCRGA